MTQVRARHVDVGGVPFLVSSLQEATRWLLEAASDPDGEKVAVRLSNAYCVALASKRLDYRQLLVNGAGVNFPDGLPVVAMMRALTSSAPRPERVRGPSLFRLALRDGVASDVRHFFLGSTSETLAALEAAARRDNPEVSVAGSYSPPFRDLDEAYLDDLVDQVRDRGADIVWVSLGTPKQDFAAQALTDRLGVIAVGVGAGFDFLAGTKPEAPAWVQRSGFEWAFRLASEPSRLWDRYLFGNSRFLLVAARQLGDAIARRRPTRGSARRGVRRG